MVKFHTDPKKQFSKWLARYGAIVWGIYVFAVLALIAYRPEAAMAAVYLTLIMTVNKAIDTVQYTKNSLGEKVILSTIEKLNLQMRIGGGKMDTSSDECTDEDEGGNG
jgi:hypothetical protein